MRQGRIKGSALLSALFVMTLVAIAATAMSTRLQLDIYRTRIIIESDSIYLASQVVPFWAMNQITSNQILPAASDNKGFLLHFPRKHKNIYQGISIEGELYDLQALFNLNNLENEQSRIVFNNLLKNILVKTNEEKRLYIVRAANHWISPYKPERGQDSITSKYLENKPPYQPAHTPMQSVSELRLIAGVNSDIYQKISPYLATIQKDSKVNINTAPKEILSAIGGGLDASEVGEIIQKRASKPIENIEDVSELLKKLGIPDGALTTESEYFLAIAKVKSASLNLTVYTVIKRDHDQQKKKYTARILKETFNNQ